MKNQMIKNKNNRLYLLVMLAGVVLIVMALIDKNNKDQEVVEDNENISEQANILETGQISQAGSIEGVLTNSNDLIRGNLKLVSGVGDVYIRTNRDFSELIGFQVLVFFNGTFENFELTDIQAKIVNDAFLISQ